MKTNWQKRIVALLLCACMLFSGSVFAEIAEEPIEELAMVETYADAAEESADEAIEETLEEEKQEIIEEEDEKNYAASASELKITKQPASVSVAAGVTAKISLTASGDGLSYTWYWKNAAGSKYQKSSITGSTYTAVMNSERAGRTVYCVVSDMYGNAVVSNIATMEMSVVAGITKQPVSVTVANGATAKVSLTATGEGLSYAWYYKNAGSSAYVKSGISTSNSYSVVMNSSRAGRQVYCIVTDMYGNTAKSNVVTLNMTNALQITKQPVSVTVANGATAKTSVTAVGEGLTYTWYWKNVASADFKKSSITTNTYTMVMDSSKDGRKVLCLVKDKHGNTVQSKAVTLNMEHHAKITKQPVSVTVANGETAKVSVTATGDGLTYTWYWKNAGAADYSKSSITTNTYSMVMDSAKNGRKVLCIVKDKYGNSVQSSVATLSMTSELKITKQPANAGAAAGATAKTSVTATGSGLKYAWYWKNAGSAEFKKSSITTNTYSAVMDSSKDGRQVYCVITDASGKTVTSNTVTLSIVKPASIVIQPKDATVESGQEAKTTVYALGEGLTYTWYYKDPGSSSYSKSSVTDYTYTAVMDNSKDGRKVYCVVSDKYGNKVTSDTVTLKLLAVTPASEFTYTISSGKVTITGYTGSRSSIAIPSSIEGYPVTAIGYSAMDNLDFVTSITLPSTLTTIESYAFDDCGALGSIKIPGSVGKIGYRAFENCDALKSLDIGYGVQVIGEAAFRDCDALTLVFVPSSITEVDEGAFNNCSALKNLTISSGVKSIGDYAFKECDALTSVSIPSTVATIGYEAFGYCDGITSLTLETGITQIENYAFYDCSALTSVSIPGTIETIGNGAFYNCDALKTVSIGYGVKKIYDSAFRDCDSLTSIAIPGSVFTIADNAFDSCSALTKVSITKGENVTIGAYAFRDCDQLTSVTLPESVTYIGYEAFANCDILTSLVIPGSALKIDGYAFANNKALKTVTMGYGTTSLGHHAFYNCPVLYSINIPGSVLSIGNSAFNKCTGLKTVTLNSGTTSIGTDAFRDCDAITSVNIPGTITAVSAGAFYDCDGLTTVKMNAGTTSMGDGAFRDCDSLISVTIPGTVTYIGDWAFMDCDKLQSITIPEGVTAIDYACFEHCDILTTVKLPRSLVNIGSSAFNSCPKLTIYVHSGSSAYTWCVNNNKKYALY